MPSGAATRCTFRRLRKSIPIPMVLPSVSLSPNSPLLSIVASPTPAVGFPSLAVNDNCILGIKRMTMNTVSLASRFRSRGIAPQIIDFWRNGFKVKRVHAKCVFAKMVNFKACRDFTSVVYPRCPVRAHALSIVATLAVSGLTDASGPFPTIALGDTNLTQTHDKGLACCSVNNSVFCAHGHIVRNTTRLLKF